MGVNYRHAFHAGNPADVLKHAILVGLARCLQRKETGFLFVDTHAGRGLYDLSLAGEGDTRPRRPEWPDGIGALWGQTDAPPWVADYLAIVRDFDRGRGNPGTTPRFYPGSPRIASALARGQDRLDLWEKQPDECAALRAEFRGARRVSVHGADGYGAIRASLPPRERRALVLLDPPYESGGEWADVTAAMGEGIRRFPGGTYAAWYPLTGRAGAGELLDSIGALGAPSLAIELVTDPDAAGMRGSGVLVVNPPWQFEDGASPTRDYLAAKLARRAGQASLRWIVPR